MKFRSTVSAACALGATLAASSALAVSPRLQAVLPHGGQRGQDVHVVLRGANLEDARELMLYDRGMEVKSLVVSDEKNRKGREVEVDLHIAADCPLGSQRMRLRTETGLTDLVLFSVGPLPVIEEKEPNTDFDSPQPILLECTVHGLIETEDVDYFAIDAKKGERINIEVVGLRLGTSGARGNGFFDPYVAVLDADRFEIAAQDDTSLVWNDPVVSFVPPADGKYFLQLRDVAYGGAPTAYYLLHVGRFPRPTAIFPIGGPAGQPVTVAFLGDASSPFEKTIEIPADAGEEFFVEASDALGTAPTSHRFRVSPLPNAFEQEPNNSTDAASVVPAPAAWNGRFEEPGDVDFYRFSAKKGQTFEVDVYARRLRSAADTVLTIRDAKGKQLAANDDNQQPDSYLRFSAPEDGEYLVELRDHLLGGGPAFTYRIEVSPVVPAVAATTAEVRRYVLPNLVIPQGGAIGVQMNVQRRDVGGPIAFAAENLPAGVTVELPEEWNNEATMPVVLRAAEDAPTAGTWTTFNLQCGDPAKADSLVHGLMSQNVLMVRGQNNDRIWEEMQTRLPVVVTQKIPFRIRLEIPATPIVQGGSLPLKVIADRDEGYNEKIRVLLLQNPPGCSSANATEIPEGQNEVVIPLNAAANAPIRISPIAIRAIGAAPPPPGAPEPQRGNRGRGNRGRGVYETCSNWAPVSVEGPYFKLDFQQAVVEQGNDVPYVVKVEPLREFEGEAELKLVGLPANAVAEPLKLTRDQKELTFAVKAAADTPTGMNKNLLCEIRVPLGEQSVSFTMGSGRLRVDPPSQAKPAAPVAKAAESAPKPVSRLEQLRQEQAAREAAQSAGAVTESE